MSEDTATTQDTESGYGKSVTGRTTSFEIQEAMRAVKAEQAAAQPKQEAAPEQPPAPKVEPAAPKQEQAPRPGEFSRKWAAEMKAKKAEAKKSQDFAGREAAIAAKQAEVDAANALLKTNPAEFFTKHGGTDAYRAATKAILGQQETIEERAARLEKELEQIKTGYPQEVAKLREELQSEKAAIALADYYSKIDAEIATDDFALVRDLDLTDHAHEVAEQWFANHGEVLPARRAAELVHEYVTETFIPQLAKSATLKAKLMELWGVTQTAKPASPNATISQDLTNDTPADDLGDGRLPNHELVRAVLRANGYKTSHAHQE